MAIKVLLVDDHPLFLKGLKSILGANEGLEIIGEAKDGQEAIKLVAEKLPDLVIMDISMPHMDGIQATKHISSTFPDTKVLALSIHSGKRFIKEMLDAGASGYLLKDSAPDELVTAIQKISEGDMYLSSNITQSALSKDEAEDEAEIPIILYTKLHRPPVMEDIIIRTEIIEKLESNIDNPLSLISAPAGYGKSLLVSQWLEQTRARYTWVSLDEELNDLRFFLLYIRAAIEKIYPGTLKKTGGLLKAGELPPIRVIAHSLLNELDQIQEDFILILDDYHTIYEESIHRLVDEILRYPPEHMHLSILSRRDPPLRLNPLQSHGRMLDIRMEELAFSAEEITSLFQKLHNILLPEATARTLQQKTEGWIVGLRLASQAIRDIEAVDRIASQLHGNFHSISTFLVQEVMSNQPVEIQDLMKITSIFNRFCAPMVEEICLKEIKKGDMVLTGDKFIQWLIKSDLFIVPLDTENYWFRYHHLFQELLNRQYEQDQNKEQSTRIHLLASKWYEDKSLIEEAIRHALLAEDHNTVAMLVENYRHIESDQDRWYVVKRWLDLIPGEIKEQRIGLLIAQLLPLFEQFRLLEMSHVLDRVNALIQGKDVEPALQGEISFNQGYLSFYLKGDLNNARKQMDKARKLVPENQKVVRAEIELMLALTRYLMGEGKPALESLKERLTSVDKSDFVIQSRLISGLVFIHLLSGDLTLAYDASRRLGVLAKDNQNVYIEAFAHCSMANVNLQSFNLDKALQDFIFAKEHQHIIHIKFAIESMVGECLTLQLLGLPEKALNKLKHFLEYARNTGDAQHIAVSESLQARLSLMQGNIHDAIQWARSFNMEIPALGMLYFQEIPSITQARVLIMAGTNADLDKSLELLSTQLQQLRNLHNIFQVIEILVLQSMAFEKLDKSADALVTLEEAVVLAGPRGWIRPFMEAGEPMARLLTKLLDKNIEVATIERLLALLEKAAPELATMPPKTSGMKPVSSRTYVPNVEEITLTQRETEILNLLAEGLRNKEIASRIYVSEDTVKKHLYNIYQKMEVNNRMELVNKSRDLGMVSNKL